MPEDEKRIWFKYNMKKLSGQFAFDHPITLVINRDNALEETLNQFDTVEDINLQGNLKIFFIDEEADDAGGVIWEWINILVQELFDQEEPYFELW